MKTQVNISEKEANLEANRHGLICVIILIIGCLGGITVGYRAIESIITCSSSNEMDYSNGFNKSRNGFINSYLLLFCRLTK